MIGSINVSDNHAVMNDDGTWSSHDRPLEIILNALYSVRDHSEADGVYGFREISAAAKRFQVEPMFVNRTSPHDFTGQKTWKEEDHPRAENGRFGEGSGGDTASEDAPKEHHDDPSKSLEERGKIAAARAEQILADGIENGDEVAAGASGWESLDDSDKQSAQESWENDHYSEYSEESEKEWMTEMEKEADDETTAYLEGDTDGAANWLAGELEKQGFDPSSIVVDSVDDSAIDIDYSQLKWANPDEHPDEDAGDVYADKYEDDLNKRWDKNIYPALQQEKYDELLEEKTQDGLPDSYKDHIFEQMSNDFYNQSDEVKLEAAGVDSSSTTTLEEPSKYEPTDSSKNGYKETRGVALYLQKKIAEQELERRGVEHADKVDLDAVASHIWSEWKSSSTTDTGLLLQYATAKELDGHTKDFTPHERSQIDEAARQLSERNGGREREPVSLSQAEQKQWQIDRGMKIAQAHVHGTWAASQHILDKAGIKELPVYRGIIFDKEQIDKEPQETVRVATRNDGQGTDYKKLTDIKLLRYGAASSTSDVSVANSWGGVGKRPPNPQRVVLRVMAPPTAVLSLPVFGQNIHHEEEVVLAGTKDWKAWDAFVDNAPTNERLKIKSWRGTIRPGEGI